MRVRGGRRGTGRLGHRKRRAVVVGLAVTATALVAAGPRDADGARGHPRAHAPAHVGSASGARYGEPTGDRFGERPGDRPGDRPSEQSIGSQRSARTVSAPVRIADAAAVRLLRPGDRVDVIAAEETARGGDVRVVARGARVAKVPEPPDGVSEGASVSGGVAGKVSGDGALVVLAVPRSTAARLAGAGATARLAVTLW
ncbi:RcpC/CpaB family pilus assembly protein [Streptomyces sp. NPDC058735]|uniref:RcpC/CpaB family pilus assembly protein n=1 Tax=unclassified Streptomyces TaxID=2593676 RepID=UPI0036BC383F